ANSSRRLEECGPDRRRRYQRRPRRVETWVSSDFALPTRSKPELPDACTLTLSISFPICRDPALGVSPSRKTKSPPATFTLAVGSEKLGRNQISRCLASPRQKTHTYNI